MHYFQLKKGLIEGWREVWNQEGNRDFPFLFAQLAPYNYGGDPTRLCGIWEAQTATLSVKNTGMAVLTDITTINDIHPPNKQEVGRRLSLWALAHTYGQKDLVYSGPLYNRCGFEGNKAIISFEHADGLKSRDGKELSWWSLAGADKKFVKASAKIEGNTVVVTADGIATLRRLFVLAGITLQNQICAMVQVCRHHRSEQTPGSTQSTLNPDFYRRSGVPIS